MTADGLALLKRFEGFRSEPYRDAVGVLTVGYGTAFPITESEASLLLESRVGEFQQALLGLVKVSLSPNQLDALTSFTYNVGLHALANSTLLEKLNQGRIDEVPAEMLRWTHGGGKVLLGLVERRKAEAELWAKS